jgi:hypothetical protein
MRKSWLRLLGALLILANLGLPGCGSGKDQLASVRGVVSYRGLPLHSGVIVFTPDVSRGTRGALAHADIQADGSYVLKTGEASGAVPGWHRITVLAVQGNSAPPTGMRFSIPQSVLPERYRDPDMSGLTREVKSTQPNVIDFELD